MSGDAPADGGPNGTADRDAGDPDASAPGDDAASNDDRSGTAPVRIVVVPPGR